MFVFVFAFALAFVHMDSEALLGLADVDVDDSVAVVNAALHSRLKFPDSAHCHLNNVDL